MDSLARGEWEALELDAFGSDGSKSDPWIGSIFEQVLIVVVAPPLTKYEMNLSLMNPFSSSIHTHIHIYIYISKPSSKIPPYTHRETPHPSIHPSVPSHALS